MANPQPGNGHTDICNDIVDRLCLYRLSGQEWQIIWVVLRKTWGWKVNPADKNSPKKKLDRIAFSQFATLTGIDRRKCHALIKRLLAKKVLKKVVTQKGDRITIKYGFQKDYDRWIVSPKKVTVTQKGARLSPKKAHTKETFTKEKILPAFDNAVDPPPPPKPEKPSLQDGIDFLLTKKNRKLKGKRFETFMLFWDAFDYKKGKREAADSWYDIPKLTDSLVVVVVAAAKIEAAGRADVRSQGDTPKMAQGWLSGARWEDEIDTGAPQRPQPKEITEEDMKNGW